MLGIVAFLLGFLFLFAKQVHSQSNNVPTNTNWQSPIVYGDPSVIYKDPEGEKQALNIVKAESLRGTWQGSCVNAVEKFLDLPDNIIVGNAKNTPINSHIPEPGAIVRTSESKKYGHVGVVLYVTETQIYIYESNYGWNNRAQTRWVDRAAPFIVGYLILDNY